MVFMGHYLSFKLFLKITRLDSKYKALGVKSFKMNLNL